MRRRTLDPIIHNLDPYLVQFTLPALGEVGIRWYSLPYFIGMILVYVALSRAVKRNEVENLDARGVENFVVAGILGALVGARFFHVFVFEYDRYGFDPLSWIAVWRGGLAFHGGLVGVVLAIVLFSRMNRIPVYRLTDLVAVPVAIALGFGRIANFINAEMYGTPYDGPFCVDYSQNEHMAAPPEDCRHPTQLYEMAKNFGMAGILYGVRERLRPRPGVITWLFVAIYGFVRFFLMFLREEREVMGTLTLSQIFSGLMGLAGLGILLLLTDDSRRRRGKA